MATRRWLNDDEQRFWRLYVDFQRRLERVLHRELVADAGLSSPEFAVLVPLSETPSGKIRARDLCRELGWDRTRLSHLVGRMERRGLVCRRACADDARGSIVEITDDGRRVITDAAPAHAEAVRRYLVDRLRDDEMATMSDVFERVLEGLERE
jgi:DNA-binding MarR family transcriptional regulator